jgi:hypothetical protein
VQEVFVLVDNLGCEASLEQRAYPGVSLVDSFRIRRGQLVHCIWEVIGLEKDHQMVVVGHEAKGDYFCDVGEICLNPIQEELIVPGLQEDGLPVYTPIVEMVIMPGSELDVSLRHLFLFS